MNEETARPSIESEELLRLVAENIEDFAIFAIDLEGRVASWNRGVQKLLGYDERDFIGRDACDIFTPEDNAQDACGREMRTAREKGRAEDKRWHLRKDGSRFWANGLMMALKDDAGELRGFAKVIRDETKRKHAEDERERFFALGSDLLVIAGFDGYFKWISPAWERTFGWTLAELTARPWLYFTHPDDHKRTIKEAEKLSTGRETVAFENRYRCKDGAYRWISWHTKPYLEEQLLYCAATDITERKEAEEERATLLAREQAARKEADAAHSYFRALFESAPGLYLVLKPDDYQIVGVSEAYLRATMTERQSIMGKQVFDVFPDDPEDPLAEGVRNLRASLERVKETRRADVMAVQRYPIRRPEAEGGGFEERYWSPINSPVTEPGGEIAYIIHRVEDVTEFVRLKQREGAWAEGRRALETRAEQMEAEVVLRAQELERLNEQLRESAERFRFMAESMPQKIFTAKPNGDVDYFNQQWTEFTGLSFEQIRDWGWTQFIHPDDVEENVRSWQRSIDTGEPFQLEHRFRRADGEYHWHLSRAHAMHDDEGRVVMWIGSNTDIDDVKRVEDELREANRLKDEFLSTLSHELRTPLTSILGWSNMLRHGQLDEATASRALETIQRNARSQVQLIDDLLDVSRIITGKLRLDVRPIELAQVIEAAVDSVRPAAEAKSIRLQVLLDPQAGPVSGDSDRLQQVVWNLLTNAVKFTPKGGRAQARLERVNSHVEITVSDTGRGIDPEFLPHVFDRFRQADMTSTRAHGGLGLGLSIVRQLVELHGGSIHAESEGEGKGATFVVQLPLMIAHRQLEMPERRHPRAGGDAPLDCPPQLAGLRVLVVEDEEDARELLSMVLESCGSEVTTVGSAAEALKLFEHAKPDVLVSDIGMPGEDGYELICKVRALEAKRGAGRIPAIALTAYARVEDRVRALNAGFQVHVPKPIEPIELVAVVASLAGRTGVV